MNISKTDYNMMYSGMIGKLFYHICEDNKNYYRTIRLQHNPFTNALVPQVSNAVYGVPPEGIDPISPHLLSRLLRMKTSMNMMEF